MTTTDMVCRTGTTARIAELDDAGRRCRDCLEASTATSTAKAHRADWQRFTAWCDGHGLGSLPAARETVALYMATFSETHKPSTLVRRAAAISQNHQAAGYSSPTRAAVVRKSLAGMISLPVGTGRP